MKKIKTAIRMTVLGIVWAGALLGSPEHAGYALAMWGLSAFILWGYNPYKEEE